MEQKYTEGQYATILYENEILLTTISKVEWDEEKSEWRYYFTDTHSCESFCYENDLK